jgi:transcriptional regulator with XRE-family HTH domain
MNNLSEVLSESRKNMGLSQKELVFKIIKEDGENISAQYYNDIEKGRRIPSNYILSQLAELLNIDLDFLFSLAEKMPDDIKEKIGNASEKQIKAAYSAFRKSFQ